MRQLACTSLFLIVLGLNMNMANTLEPDGPYRPVQFNDGTTRNVFHHGIAQSPSFRELVATLDLFDRTVSLEHAACRASAGVTCPHAMPVMTSAKTLLLRFDARPPLTEAIGRAAHGLYHAVEIGREPNVTDEISRRRLFARIGEHACHHDTDACSETRAAVAFEALVIRELTGQEPPR